jgi:hypothetical protein
MQGLPPTVRPQVEFSPARRCTTPVVPASQRRAICRASRGVTRGAPSFTPQRYPYGSRDGKTGKVPPPWRLLRWRHHEGGDVKIPWADLACGCRRCSWCMSSPARRGKVLDTSGWARAFPMALPRLVPHLDGIVRGRGGDPAADPADRPGRRGRDRARVLGRMSTPLLAPPEQVTSGSSPWRSRSSCGAGGRTWRDWSPAGAGAAHDR